MSQEAGRKLLGVVILFALVGSVVAITNSPDLQQSAPQQSGQSDTSSQDRREQIAEKAFEQIDNARNDYPPLGADPTNYNAAITKAYHAWERTAESAYGNKWRSMWQAKHAGGTEGCAVAHANGMPLEACYEAAASEGEIEPLDNMLMKCPSWDDPSGAIFNPSDSKACARRKATLERAARTRLKHAIEGESDGSTAATDKSSAEPGNTSAPSPATTTENAPS